MSLELLKSLVVALLSGGLASLITVIVTAKQNAKKLKIDESDTIINNYKELLSGYMDRFKILNERLDLLEKKYALSVELSEKQQEKIEKLNKEVIHQACVIEDLENKVAEAKATAETYLERIKKLEEELSVYQGGGNNGFKISQAKQ